MLRSSPSAVIRLALLGLVACGGTGAAPRPAESGAEAGPVGAARAPFELEELSISELQRRMEIGELSSEEITAAYLERIERHNRRGAALRALIETNPDALTIAAGLDRERAAGSVRGPLHGIPILLKDNIGTADRMETTAGSLALVGRRPAEDAVVAARLREAGAVLLGKANMSEWANFRSSAASSGWSARGGQARNPYDLDRSPCGSSSGSASAVAASMAAAAIGTETNGSIICPSSANGVVGLKPTVGLVPRTGIVPLASSFDTAGPMGRSVRDVAIVLAAIAGPDPSDPRSEGVGTSPYLEALGSTDLSGARIGVARNSFGVDPRVDAVIESALAAMRQRGAILVDIELPTWSELGAPALEVMLFEFKRDIDRYLAALPGPGPRTLEELIAFNREHADEELVHFGQELFLRAQAQARTDASYRVLRDDVIAKARAGIDDALDQHQLDAIAAPSGGPAWMIDPVNGDHFRVGSSTPAAVAGYPNLSVPAGFVRGLPVGISLLSGAGNEARLLQLGHALEQATQARKPPAL